MREDPSKICEGTELTKKQSAEAVEKIIEVLKSTLESGDEVLVSGFGKFSVKEKNERKAGNPATGIWYWKLGKRSVLRVLIS